MKKTSVILLFLTILLSLKSSTLHAQTLRELEQESRETVADYFAQLAGLGDPALELSERRKFKEAIIRNFGYRYKTIVFNNLNPHGSTHLKFPEYLSLVLSAFPEGVTFDFQVKRVHAPQLTEEADGVYCKVFVQVKAYRQPNNELLSDKELLFNISFKQQGVGDYEEGKIMAIDLSKGEENPPVPKMSYGSLSLTSNNIQGHVYIDDIKYQYISKGATVQADHLTPGNHTVKIKSSGRILWSQEIYVTAGKTSFLTAHTDIPSLSPILRHLVNNIVTVQGGTFTMGCTSEQGSDCQGDEKPLHQVTLSSYSIGKYEVTQEEWREVMGSNPSNHKNCDKCPVEQVNWNDAQAFIKKLNQKTSMHFRLPTEAEWEYAARGGNRSKGYKYCGSNNINSIAWYGDNSGSETHPVGSKSPNELGLYDMSGNVWEWCSDRYDGDYYSKSPLSNPKGPSTGSHRVFRGGCWRQNPRGCRSTDRDSWYPGSWFKDLGFRLAMSR